MDEKASGRIKAFLGFLREAEEEYRIALAQEEDANKETQDILHWMEFNVRSGVDYGDVLKLSDAQAETRRSRRRAKDAAAVLEPAVKWAADNAAVVKSLERLQGEVKKAERSAENRHYIDRTDIVARTLGEKKGEMEESEE